MKLDLTEIANQFKINMDYTQNLKKRLQETELAYLSALEISQFKSEYLGKIAHELRSPISTLVSLHQLIISDLCDSREEEREFIEEAYEYAQKLIGLIDQVVQISQIESGRIELNLQPLSLKEILAEVYNRTYLQVANRNLNLEISKVNEDLSVMGDEKKLVQALVTLIDAIVSKATVGGIIITVSNSSGSNLLSLNIDTPLTLKVWQELTLQKTLTKDDVRQKLAPPQFSLDMKMTLAKNLLEIMGGQLKLQELSSQVPANYLTRLQCLLPLHSVSAETQ